MEKVKEKIYKYLVDSDIRIKSHYEGYIISNPEYHKEHRLESYKFLFALRNYYKKNGKGKFPVVPCSYCQRFPDEMMHINQNSYELIKNSAYFDEKWYYENYPDVKESGMDAVTHYLNVGWKEFRKPGPSFSTLLYLNRYSDVNNMHINPLLHYELYGKIDKRISSYQKLLRSIQTEIDIILNSVFWDEQWYKNKYLKGDLTKELPVVHYYCIGCYLEMDPGPVFSHKIYEKEFPEVKKFPIPYLLHYELQKRKGGKGYINSATAYYNNKDLQISILTGMYHASTHILEKFEKAKRVLLISHLMNLTGAPKVLLNMAIILKRNGYMPVIATLKPGNLIVEAEKKGIEVITLAAFEDKRLSENIVSFANLFGVVLYNTIESMRLAHILKNIDAYKIAWLHEGKETIRKISDKQIYRINSMDRIFTCAQYCNKFFMPYLYSQKEIEVLHYGIEEKEIANNSNEQKHLDDKLIFITIGTIGFRKGHDILLNAISMLSADFYHNVEFWFVGSVIDEAVGKKLDELKEKYNCIKYFGEVPNSRAIDLLSNASVLICPSIDDPMPVVITEAFILKKAVLTTTHVGTAQFIDDKVNGFLISQINEQTLHDYIIYIINNKNILRKVGEKGYLIYKKYLSSEIFEKKVKEIFDETYNCSENRMVQELHVIDNKVFLYDIEIGVNYFDFIFSCDEDNEIYLFSEGDVYKEKNYTEEKWKCLNEYFIEKKQRLAIIRVMKSCILNFSAIVVSNNFDTMNLNFGQYCWSTLHEISDKYDICIALEENVIKILDKAQFLSRIMSSSKVPIGDKKLLDKIKNIKKHPYTIYCETRDNRNDNAYQLFLLDLMTNPNAYFITTKLSYEMEKDEYIKKHLLIINSEKAKEYMMHSKGIVVSWFAMPIFGEERMKLFYPFLHINYIFVPHGISYDKNSFYLNKSIWGTYKATYVSSKLEKEYLEKCNGYRNVLIKGYPRMDKWFNCHLNQKQVFVFPTWRSNISDQYIELISEICEYITNEFPDMQIIYVAHPSIEQNVFFSIEQKLEKISKEIIVFHSNESDKFNIFFSSSKFLITDYSSIAYDFSYKENAVAIYYEPLANMEANYQIRREFYENNCGLIAKNLEEIGMIFKEKYDKQYLENQVKKFFEYRDNYNTQRVRDSIQDFLEND